MHSRLVSSLATTWIRSETVSEMAMAEVDCLQFSSKAHHLRFLRITQCYLMAAIIPKFKAFMDLVVII